MSEKTAVNVVDLQADFLEARGGSLAVAGTNQAYIDQVVQATRQYADQGLPIIATQDWHPAQHCSFASNNPGSELFQVIDLQGRPQIMWPDHCVQQTPGSELVLPPDLVERVVRKGSDPRFDSYSGFADQGGAPTGLEDLLKELGIDRVIIYGLATDFCVKETTLHALAAGFKTQVRLDLCRGVAPETTEQAVEEMKRAGAELI